MSAVMEKPWPAAISASTMPTSDTGMVKSMTNGSRSDLNCDAMIMKTTMTASPSARPSPPKVVRISSTCPRSDSRMPRVRGSQLERLLQLGSSGPDVAPFGLHEDVRGALEVVALDGDRGRRRAGYSRMRRAGPACPSALTRTGSAAERPRVGDLRSVVGGDDVVRLAVDRVDPHAGRVDIPERGLERRLRRVARRDAHEPRLLAVRVDVQLGIVVLQRRRGRRGCPRRCARPRRWRLACASISARFSPRTSTTNGAVYPLAKTLATSPPGVLEHLDPRELAREDRTHLHGDLRPATASALRVGEREPQKARVRGRRSG